MLLDFEEYEAVKAIEVCASAITADDCEGCPYATNDEKCDNMKNKVVAVLKKYKERTDELETIVDALRKNNICKGSEMEQYCNGFAAGKVAGISEILQQRKEAIGDVCP